VARFNVNAARAQRLEALGQEWEFEVDEDVFRMPTEFPRSFAKQIAALEDNDIDGLLALLLGLQQFERFCKHDVSVQDVSAILEAYGNETGMTLGEG
jgi:flavodoxin